MLKKDYKINACQLTIHSILKFKSCSFDDPVSKFTCRCDLGWFHCLFGCPFLTQGKKMYILFKHLLENFNYKIISNEIYLDSFLIRWPFYNSIHINARHMYMVRIQLTDRYNLFNLSNRNFGCFTHCRIEISSRLLEN